MNCHGPKSFHFALEGMQVEARYIHIGYDARGVKPGQNVTQLLSVFSDQAARIVVVVKTLQPFVAD